MHDIHAPAPGQPAKGHIKAKQMKFIDRKIDRRKQIPLYIWNDVLMMVVYNPPPPPSIKKIVFLSVYVPLQEG